MNNRYSHLYQTSQYIPPSTLRSVEEAMPVRSSVFGETVNLQGRNTVENVSGQNSMNNFFDIKLRNKDIYREMKNKTLYSLNSKIVSHGALNTL